MREVSNVVEAIGKGLLSPALSARPHAAERELESLQGNDRVIDVKAALALVGSAVEAYRHRVDTLPETNHPAGTRRGTEGHP